VQQLQFSPPWIYGFLTRNLPSKLTINTGEKTVVAAADVQKTMEGIQGSLREKEVKPKGTVAADETAVHYGVPPKQQFAPEGQARGSAPGCDEKVRYTSMQAAVAEGEDGDAEAAEVLPSHNIIKCSSRKADLSKTRVLKTLHAQPGFTAADGWELHIWRRTLTLKGKNGKETTAEYVRPYLKHTSGTVIKIQHKAWMDSVGCCMWVDVLLGPVMKRRQCNVMLIWDNCGSHCVSAVQMVLKEWGIFEEKLHKNTTGETQVPDLIMNGPYKAGIRRARCRGLFSFFQNWKIKRLHELAKPVDQRVLPPFDPPKPTVAEGLLTGLKVEAEVFTKKEFKLALKKCFVNAGQAPQQDGSFIKYTGKSKMGSLVKTLLPKGAAEENEMGSLAQLAGAGDSGAAEEPASDDDDEPSSDDEQDE